MTDQERKEKRKATKDKWRAANPDKVREQARRYRAANREKVREQVRKYREANRAKVCEQIGQSGADVVGGNLGIAILKKSSNITP